MISVKECPKNCLQIKNPFTSLSQLLSVPRIAHILTRLNLLSVTRRLPVDAFQSANSLTPGSRPLGIALTPDTLVSVTPNVIGVDYAVISPHSAVSLSTIMEPLSTIQVLFAHHTTVAVIPSLTVASINSRCPLAILAHRRETLCAHTNSTPLKVNSQRHSLSDCTRVDSQTSTVC